MMGTLRSWIFYVGLRNAPGTQREHRQIARAIGDTFAEQVPIIFDAVVEAAYNDNNSGLEGWQHV
jgi:thymidylate synthase (FAD)